MSTKNRGFASMPKNRVSEIAQMGGDSSPTKFEKGSERAREAGRKGGRARATAPDVKSGELGRKGAKARWSKK